MTVVMTNHFVVLQVPALYLLVFAARKKIWLSRRNGKSSNGRNVASERKFESSRGKIPYFDDSIVRTGGKPLVARFDSNTTNPTGVSRNDAKQLPRSVPIGFGHLELFAWRN